MAIEDDKPSGQHDAKHVDIWVCEGRMCSAKGAGDLAQIARTLVGQQPNARVLRGGCYGQCDLSPNVVVREHAVDAAPDVDVNRLSRTFADNETVYARVDERGLNRIVDAHLNGGDVPVALTLQEREKAEAPANDVAARIRALRLKRRAERQASDGPAQSHDDTAER